MVNGKIQDGVNNLEKIRAELESIGLQKNQLKVIIEEGQEADKRLRRLEIREAQIVNTLQICRSGPFAPTPEEIEAAKKKMEDEAKAKAAQKAAADIALKDIEDKKKAKEEEGESEIDKELKEKMEREMERGKERSK